MLVTALLVGGCGGDVDADKAEEQIKKGIAAQGKAEVKYVKCPSGVKAEKGATFQCEALIPVNVTQVDENGNVRWQITSFIGPPSGTTGATGATGLAGPTGVTPPGGATGQTPGGASPGSVRDDPRFDRYTNRSQGYTISHPLTWKRVGSGRDVSFPFPGGSRYIHVVIHDFNVLPTPAAMRKSLREQTGVQKILEVRRDRVGEQPVLYSRYTFKGANARVAQVIKRYVFATDDKRALIEFGANAPLADKKLLVKKFDRSVRSFRWLRSGT